MEEDEVDIERRRGGPDSIDPKEPVAVTKNVSDGLPQHCTPRSDPSGDLHLHNKALKLTQRGPKSCEWPTLRDQGGYEQARVAKGSVEDQTIYGLVEQRGEHEGGHDEEETDGRNDAADSLRPDHGVQLVCGEG